MILFEIILGYIIGFFISLVILTKWGKKISYVDYDKEKTYETMDDWDSNAQAYLGWSIIWPIFWGFLMVLRIIIQSLILLIQSFINYFGKK